MTRCVSCYRIPEGSLSAVQEIWISEGLLESGESGLAILNELRRDAWTSNLWDVHYMNRHIEIDLVLEKQSEELEPFVVWWGLPKFVGLVMCIEALFVPSQQRSVREAAPRVCFVVSRMLEACLLIHLGNSLLREVYGSALYSD